MPSTRRGMMAAASVAAVYSLYVNTQGVKGG